MLGELFYIYNNIIKKKKNVSVLNWHEIKIAEYIIWEK